MQNVDKTNKLLGGNIFNRLVELFPNPFNGITTIRYSLPEASSIKLSVFDLSGREVALLVTGELQAGNHTAFWNAEGSSSGIYLVKIETPTFTRVGKMTRLK